MKGLAAVFLVLWSVASVAQNQALMEKMQQMQACISNIDQAELKQIEARAQAFEAEIKALCQADKRDAALRKAMAFSVEVSNAKAVKQMRECTEGMEALMPRMPFEVPELEDEGFSDHICDH